MAAARRREHVSEIDRQRVNAHQDRSERGRHREHRNDRAAHD
jgi:hypothetical protein